MPATASRSRAWPRSDLVQLMIGRAEQIAELAGPRPRRRRAGAGTAQACATALGHRDIDLTLHQGEILGLYGLVGAGRTELAKAIIGRCRVTGGEVRVKGEAGHGSARSRRRCTATASAMSVRGPQAARG